MPKCLNPEDSPLPSPYIQPLLPILTPPPPKPSTSLCTTIANKLSKRFAPFPRLPTEIRLEIWKHCLPGPRVHELHPCTKLLENGKMMFRSNYSKPPILLSVSHEARSVALSEYQLMDYDAPSGTKGIRKFYFSPENDTLFLNTLMGLYMAFMLLESELDIDSPLGRGVMGGWRNVALDADRAHLIDLLAGYGDRNPSPRLREVFPDLRRFTIAFDFTKKGKTRFRMSVWPGENGTSLKGLEGETEKLGRLLGPIRGFMVKAFEGRGKEEGGEVEVGLAKVKRKRYLRGDLRYGFRKTCKYLHIKPPGIFMRL